MRLLADKVVIKTYERMKGSAKPSRLEDQLNDAGRSWSWSWSKAIQVAAKRSPSESETLKNIQRYS